MLKASTILFLVLLLPVLLSGDEYSQSVSVESVSVYVTAKDAQGHFVTDLKPSDFLIRENNVDQSIEDFTNFSDDHATRKVPLTLLFLLDGSGSMKSREDGLTRMDTLKKGIAQFLDNLQSADRIKVIQFTTIPWNVSPMSSDRALIKQKVAAMDARSGRTSLYDCLEAALEEMKQYNGRKVIVLGSDGADNSSHMTLEQCLQQVKGSDVTILAFGTAPADQSENSNRFVLESIAQASGGYALFPETQAQIAKVIDDVRIGMKSQYLISYTPHRMEEQQNWRQIEVLTRRPGIVLRYREGYFLE